MIFRAYSLIGTNTVAPSWTAQWFKETHWHNLFPRESSHLSEGRRRTIFGEQSRVVIWAEKSLKTACFIP